MNYIKGSYGFDILSIFLLIIYFLLSIPSYTRPISIFFLIYVLFRMFSKNTYKRSKELAFFTNTVNKVLSKFGKSIPYTRNISLDEYLSALDYKIKQKKQFKIVKCPNCKQKLRLPRGQKKIIVTCKKCSHEFKLKT